MDLTGIQPAAMAAKRDMSSNPKSHSGRAVISVVEDLLFGSLAGIAGRFIEYPFDTVKVRLQSQPHKRPLRYKGPLDCFQQSIRQDGMRSLYRGISAPLAGAALESSSLFVWEQTAREAIISAGLYPRDSPLPLSALFLTGSIAGAFTSFVLTPVELIKCKMQVPAVSPSDSIARAAQTPLSIIRQVFRHKGIMGFWNGQLGTLIRETGGSAAWFGGKETATMLFRRFGNRDVAAESAASDGPIRPAPLPIWQQAISGAAAGISYNFLFFPADTVKSRIQTASVEYVSARTFWKEWDLVWKEHGIRGLYRGCGITLLRSAPSSALIFIIYDSLKSNFHLG